MKPQLLLPILVLSACSTPDAREFSTQAEGETPQPARYAGIGEEARLKEEARKNFERERELQRTGAVRLPEQAPRYYPPPASGGGGRYSSVEVRYAMQIGKHPSQLTPEERVLAHIQ